MTLDERTMRTLVAMARTLYPHDFLDDAPYRRAVEIVIDGAATPLLADGAASLDEAAGGRFADLPESGRVAALTAIEGSAFFETVRAGIVRHLYSDPAVRPHFGYEGPSAHLGGYIKRGYGDVSWIPDESRASKGADDD